MFNSWSANLTFDKANFATAKAGDKIIITAAPAEDAEWEYNSQVFIKTTRSGWSAISSTLEFTEAKELVVLISDDAINVKEEGSTDEIATTMLSELKNYGLALQGRKSKVTKVELVSSTPTTEKELTLTEGHTVLTSEFDSYADNIEVKLSFTNTTDPYASRKGWGIGGFANADNWEPTYTLTAIDGQSFNLYVTVGDFKTAAKNGTDNYVESQYHRTGVTFNIYNDCKLTNVYLLVPDTSTGIDAVQKTAVQKQDGVRYNLAGQKVSDSYKGIVIMNGKKVVIK